ncbi:MAG TPA: MoxR family ATPase [Bacilli bacterium]
MDATYIYEAAKRIKDNISRVIVGKEQAIDCLLVALFASGHALLEDVPGTGKTLLAKTLAKSLDCSFKRIQFTPDLLPSDIGGIHAYNPKTGEFSFRPGPVFTQILLADEINRATPRTQSVLLECMEERQITIDGETFPLKQPFFVIATQNPVESHGTFPLPEAQLDRFLLKIRMGYPSTEESLTMLKRFKEKNPFAEIAPALHATDIIRAQAEVARIFVSDDLLRYLLTIAEKTRSHRDIVLGVSPRGSQALLKAAQIFAALKGREFVTPDDIVAMAEPVLAHRLVLKPEIRLKDGAAENALRQIIDSIPVPTEQIAADR